MSNAETTLQPARKTDLKKYTMLIALVGLMLVLEVLTLVVGDSKFLVNDFFAPTNITNLISQNSYVVILAVGMLLCILTGGNIDLSVGSGVCMISAIAGTMIVKYQANIYLTIVVCLLVGIGIGAMQAFFIAYVRIPPFITTLAGMLLFRGIGYIILGGFTLSPFPDEYIRIFNGFFPGSGASAGTRVTVTMAVAAALCMLYIAVALITRGRKISKGYPVEAFSAMLVKMVLIIAVILAVFWLLGQNKGIPVVLVTLALVIFVYQWYTAKSVPGRYLYAMGGNEKATIFSGVDTKKMMFFAYTNMGFLVAVASLVCIARFNAAAPSAGNMYELDAIGSCFIGGASAYGGVGTVGGSVIGAVFIGALNNGMSILGVDANWQRAVKGLVLLVAVLIDVQSQMKRGGGIKGIFGLKTS
ncbi:MAG: sugar ABC transporter permease [Clostridiales Family XIII bacterium]|jgi:putative multiple sugar transport system permease protein|nr:sugar ABC transporter permease [Clostridiales Family XIII bacterium]